MRDTDATGASYLPGNVSCRVSIVQTLRENMDALPTCAQQQGIKRLASLPMIGMIAQQAHRPIQLLGNDHPDKRMRKSQR